MEDAERGSEMGGFVGRVRELASLDKTFARVAAGVGGPHPGLCLFVRGRRRVGKSRLIETFIQRSGAPYLFFTAAQLGERELEQFSTEGATSSLENAAVFGGVVPTDWDGALGLLAAALPDDQASIVVIDEFPYLIDEDPSIEGIFQKHWDRHLSKKPVLLLLVGSDIAAMEALNTPSRPMYHRGSAMVVSALSPAEVANIVKPKTASDAFDAYLVTGGMPMLCDEWPTGSTADEYLEDVLEEPSSMFVTSGQLSLAAEFPSDAQALKVLTQIGSGETTFSNIARAAGGIQSASLNRALDILVPRGIVVRETPLSTKKSKEARYRLGDPYLQFWLRFVGPHMAEIDRTRGDIVMARVRSEWLTWRGKAIEPVVREALMRLLPLSGIDASAIGGYWTRTNTPEVDLVGGDKGPVAGKVTFAGSVKWRDSKRFDSSDFAELAADVQKIPGASASTPMVAVSRTGSSTKSPALVLGPEELLAAWP